ncbi:fatty acid desaturase family protein, partial [Micromonospora deserti]
PRFRTPVRHRGVEGLLLVVHTVAYVGALLLVMSPLKALLFAAVHQGLWGLYMGCSFAPNHKGMPMPTAADELDFLRKQVLTSRNVRGSRLVDLALGGLNYQIEHHLFPNMPRANLRRARPLVRAYCAERGVPYVETGLVESYRQALAHLHEVGRPLRGD